MFVRFPPRPAELRPLPHPRKTAAHLSSEALSSNTASLYVGPSSPCANARMLVVLPVPGGPCDKSMALWAYFRTYQQAVRQRKDAGCLASSLGAPAGTTYCRNAPHQFSARMLVVVLPDPGGPLAKHVLACSRGCRVVRLRTRMRAHDIGACDHTARTALHSQPSADPAFVRRAPSAERGDGYSATAAAAAGRKNEALADRMMLGKLPSRPMTCRRDTASVLPTTSSMFFGRYFSTCESTETEVSYMSKILDTMGRFRAARHLINVLRQVLVRLQEPCQSR